AAPLLVFWAVNGFGGYALDIEGFGLYSMPLDAPFNPFRVDYSRFVRPAPVANGQLYEGFQYLGAGLLFLMGAAALTLAVSASARGRLKEMGRFLWLVPALLALTALALSDAVQLHGHVVADGKQSWLPPAFTGAFRASGRLFWPCAYALVLGSLELVFALRRRIALALGLTALALQAADLTSFAAIQRLWTARAAEPQRWEKTPSPLWEPLIAKAGVIEFEPPDPHFDETLFYEIGLRATSQNRPVTIMYTSRVRPAQQAIEAASRERFLTGRIDPRRLYVLMDGCAPAGLPAERLRQLDGVLLIPPAGAGLALPVASPPEPFPLGRTVALTPRTPRLRCMLGDDWSVPEPWGVWSEGPAPELILRLGAPPSRDLLLTLGARPYPDAQGVTVIVGGRPVARLNLVGQPADYRLRIPKDALRASLLHILLRVDRPTSPMERGASPDRRRLGIGLGSIRLDETR
ncbi:MAG: hypothetical protein JF615_08445, partial [Asticcacaulis sp.]|nr:hypothetical protein [Asticcacaulis sp.]